jgi:hypothetical protein
LIVEFCNLNTVLDKNVPSKRLLESAMDAFLDEWIMSGYGILGKSDQSRNKLKLYQKIKFDFRA